MVDRAFNGATISMTEYHDQFRFGRFGRVREAADDVRIDEVPGNADREDIADLLDENELCKCAVTPRAIAMRIV
jgi:hypothetical protein